MNVKQKKCYKSKILVSSSTKDFAKIIIITYLSDSLILKCGDSFENYLLLNHPLLAV